MHARVVTGHYQPDKENELDQVAKETSSSRQSLPGFKHFIGLVDPQTKEFLTIMLWETEQHAQDTHSEHQKTMASIKHHLTGDEKTKLYEVRYFE